MKISLVALTTAILTTSCFPAKRFARIDGVVVDHKTNSPISDVRIESFDVARNMQSQGPAQITDEDGLFKLPSRYGVAKLLEATSDIRELRISKDGYIEENIQVTSFSLNNRRYEYHKRHNSEVLNQIGDQMRIKLKKQ